MSRAIHDSRHFDLARLPGFAGTGRQTFPAGKQALIALANRGTGAKRLARHNSKSPAEETKSPFPGGRDALNDYARCHYQ